jgi:hypothetical protein
MKIFKDYGNGSYVCVSIRQCSDGLVVFPYSSVRRLDGKDALLRTLSIQDLASKMGLETESLSAFFSEKAPKCKSIMFFLRDARIERAFALHYKSSGRNPCEDYVISESLVTLSKVARLIKGIQLAYRTSLLSAKHGLSALLSVNCIVVPWWQINVLSLKIWHKVFGVNVISLGRTNTSYSDALYGEIYL